MPAVELALITCEHGGHAIPQPFRALFRGHQDILRSHQGFDAGALGLARELARRFNVPLVASTTSRLLVDLNRSPDNPQVFSLFTRSLDRASRNRLLRLHHAPHRSRVCSVMSSRLRRRGARLLHLAVHSFTPIWKGHRRDVDIGLLYDPCRPHELRLAKRWRQRLQLLQPRLRVRLNSPYRGWTDGLCTTLRHTLGSDYLGIELEMNQRLLRSGGGFGTRLPHDLQVSLSWALTDPPHA